MTAIQDAQWVTITGPHAFCHGCGWMLHGDHPSVGAKRLMSSARAHAKSSGHRVRIERGQSRYVDPPTAAPRETGASDEPR